MASCKLPYLWAHWWQVWELSFFSSGQKCDWNATLRLKCLRWLPMLLSCSWACFQVPGQAQGQGDNAQHQDMGVGAGVLPRAPPHHWVTPAVVSRPMPPPGRAAGGAGLCRFSHGPVLPGDKARLWGGHGALSSTSAQQRERGGARQGFRSGVQVLINFAC